MRFSRRLGSSVIPYALLLGLIAAVAISAISLLGRQSGTLMSSVANAVIGSGANAVGGGVGGPTANLSPQWTTLAGTVINGGMVGSAMTLFDVIASDPEGGVLNFTMTGQPSGLSIANFNPTTGRISGSPTGSGSFAVTLRATDPQGNFADLAVTINVAAVAASCHDYKLANPAAANGSYTLDFDGNGPFPAFATSCDFTTEGGNWTLVADLRSGVSLASESGESLGDYTQDANGIFSPYAGAQNPYQLNIQTPAFSRVLFERGSPPHYGWAIGPSTNPGNFFVSGNGHHFATDFIVTPRCNSGDAVPDTSGLNQNAMCMSNNSVSKPAGTHLLFLRTKCATLQNTSGCGDTGWDGYLRRIWVR